MALHQRVLSPAPRPDISNLEPSARSSNTIFTRLQLLLIALYKTSTMFYKHQHSTPQVLINNSFVSELESQFSHRKVTFKRNKDVRAGFDMLCEIGRYWRHLTIFGQDRPVYSLATQNISIQLDVMFAIYLGVEVTIYASSQLL